MVAQHSPSDPSNSSDNESLESSTEESEEEQPTITTRPRAAFIKINPLNVRFSQMKMRHLFGDGRRVVDAVPLIRATKCTEEEEAAEGAQWKLDVPFPLIEVIRWRCKIRDSKTGRPKLDPDTGRSLYNSEEQWFTLDNRRLYTLQEAALKFWPEKCMTKVKEIHMGSNPHMLALRKFRTLDMGNSVMIGSRSDGVPFVRWSWRAKVGMDGPVSSDDLEAVARLLKVEGGIVSIAMVANVFEHLSALKPDDYERTEISKRLSWILRRGAQRMNIDIDEESWVKVKDILTQDFLKGISEPKFLEIVAASNKQKRRYEVTGGENAKYIRACSRIVKNGSKTGGRESKGREKGGQRVDIERSADGSSSATKGGKSVGAGAAKGKGSGVADRTQAAERSKASGSKAINKVAKQMTPGLVVRDGNQAAGAKDLEPAKIELSNSSAQELHKAEDINKASGPAPTAKRPQPKSTASTSTPGRPPPSGMLNRKGRTPAEGAYLQALHQMHMMNQMHQARSMAAMMHMQTAMYAQAQMQMMAAYQMQAARQMHAVHGGLSPIQQFLASQGLNVEDDEDEEEYEEEEYEDEEEEGTGSAEPDIQTRIQEAISAARERSGISTAPLDAETLQAQLEWQEWESQVTAKPTKPAKSVPASDTDVEAKVAKVLEAAKKRNASSSASSTSASTPAKTNAQTPAIPAQPADIKAKIAEALEAARGRNGATNSNHFYPP